MGGNLLSEYPTTRGRGASQSLGGPKNSGNSSSNDTPGMSLEEVSVQNRQKMRELAAGSANQSLKAAEAKATWNKIRGILRQALGGKGNFGLGSGTYNEAMDAGRAWVGNEYRTAANGKILISKDGLRQFRAPSLKPNLGKVQANFETRSMPNGPWQSNGHLDIYEP